MVPLTSYPGREAEPTFSPDGSQVAFSWDGERQDNRDIYVKVIGSERPLRLTSDPALDGSPAWSPDGSQIAFLREQPGGGSEVRLVSPTGGAERRLGQAHHAGDGFGGRLGVDKGDFVLAVGLCQAICIGVQGRFVS